VRPEETNGYGANLPGYAAMHGKPKTRVNPLQAIQGQAPAVNIMHSGTAQAPICKGDPWIVNYPAHSGPL